MRGKGALIRVHHLTIFTFFLFSPPVLFYALAMDRQAGPIRITQEHLVAALRETRPSVSASERQQYDRMYVNFQAEKTEKEWKNNKQGTHLSILIIIISLQLPEIPIRPQPERRSFNGADGAQSRDIGLNSFPP